MVGKDVTRSLAAAIGNEGNRFNRLIRLDGTLLERHSSVTFWESNATRLSSSSFNAQAQPGLCRA